MDYRQGDLRGRRDCEIVANETGSIGVLDTERRTFQVLAETKVEAENMAYAAAHAMGLEHVRLTECDEVVK